MNQRPRSITIISWLFIIFGSIALLYGMLPLRDIPGHWYVHLSRILQIVAGAFMLCGRNWARWLLVAWIAFHLVVGALNGIVPFLMHVVIFSVILFFIFRRDANAYFAGGLV
ncbi:MAG TPA: hypothetical protein VFI24_16795 [Pyrinomonadaceae bacterium]|nr:hypothetical protein [Pyrinomonadaceae bacterium]